jgi:hypothetical protein
VARSKCGRAIGDKDDESGTLVSGRELRMKGEGNKKKREGGGGKEKDTKKGTKRMDKKDKQDKKDINGKEINTKKYNACLDHDLTGVRHKRRPTQCTGRLKCDGSVGGGDGDRGSILREGLLFNGEHRRLQKGTYIHTHKHTYTHTHTCTHTCMVVF